MNLQIIDYYSSLRQIFGLCDNCCDVFRLSDCKIYQNKKPSNDWKEAIDNEITRLDKLEERLQEKIDIAREAAVQSGKRDADKYVKKIDRTFSPLKLNPNDAKVIFHPVDFIVFNGMNSNDGNTTIKNLILLDKKKEKGIQQKIQNSIEKTVSKYNYEWLTLRVEENGTITEE